MPAGGTGTPVTSGNVRAGMANLIARLRGMTETAAGDYSVNGEAYWTDAQLQTVLDQYRTEINLWPLQPVEEHSGGATIFKDYPIGATDLEEAASNTGNVLAWSVTDSTGTVVSTDDYTPDYVTGLIRFDANTNGELYFLKARSYNLNAAAADVWRRKMAHSASAYDFSTEGQSFSRSGMFKQASEMVGFYEGKIGIQTSTFIRTDLA